MPRRCRGSRREPAERSGQPDDRQVVQRRPAPVDSHGLDPLSGEPLDGARDRRAEAGGRGRGRSACPSRTRRSWRAWRRACRSSSGRGPRVGGRRGRRRRARCSSMGYAGVFCRASSVRPASSQDVADSRQVERLSGVARAGQGQQVGRHVEPGFEHGQGLQRLARRTREDRAGRVAPALRDRTVGRCHDGGPVVDAFDNAGAHHVREDRRLPQGGGQSEGIRPGGCRHGGPVCQTAGDGHGIRPARPRVGHAGGRHPSGVPATRSIGLRRRSADLLDRGAARRCWPSRRSCARWWPWPWRARRCSWRPDLATPGGAAGGGPGASRGLAHRGAGDLDVLACRLGELDGDVLSLGRPRSSGSRQRPARSPRRRCERWSSRPW